MTGPDDAAAGEFLQEGSLKLLFVDDDPILREFALVNLASDRWSVAVAGDGAEALAAIRRDCPDLVLLDLRMPKVDGFQVLHALRSDEQTKRLPVMVITGSDDVASIDRAFSEGATSFLVKPINWRLLNYQIRYVDRSRRTELALMHHARELERREREQAATSAELAIALRGAAAGSEAKSQFLAAMSHELRTPLNAIIGFSEILAAEKFGPLGNPRYAEYTRDILSSGNHLLSLVTDILEYSRATVAGVPFVEEEFDPAEVIDEAVRILSGQAQAGGIQVSTQAALPALALRGERRRVRQVMLNLLSNAIKYTPSGGRATVQAAEGEEGLTIAVRDTGIGIAEKDIAKCLEHFGRVENSFARKYDGVGLGLPIARQFMELHGGTLRLESTLGVGTVVTVTFPPSRVVKLVA